MKVTKIASGYYKITKNVNVYEVSYDDLQKHWIIEIEVNNSNIGMTNSLDYVTITSTLKNCKLIIEELNK
tara:strand:+ start:309 stop:518 length:210 start_codon:yes stop_codon:yes gene_type:complete